MLTVVALIVGGAACGSGSVGDSSPNGDGPWTRVSVPTTQPLEVTTDSGGVIEIRTICAEVQADGVFDGSENGWLFTPLKILGLDAAPGEACDVELIWSATATRRCAHYAGLGTCCPGYEASAVVRLVANGEQLAVFDEVRDEDLPTSLTRTRCDDSSDLVFTGFPEIRDELDNRLGVMLFGACRGEGGLDAGSFWRLVAALHHEDSDIVDEAAKRLRGCADLWNQRGRADEGIPYLEAVPHLVAVAEWQSSIGGALRSITGEPGPQQPGDRSAWWDWWETRDQMQGDPSRPPEPEPEPPTGS